MDKTRRHIQTMQHFRSVMIKMEELHRQYSL